MVIWVVLVVVFFNVSSSSGLPLLLLPLKPPPGLQKPVPGPPGLPVYSLLAPGVRLLAVLEQKLVKLKIVRFDGLRFLKVLDLKIEFLTLQNLGF